MDASDYAAWYAAVVATGALYLQYARDRIRLRVRARGGMRMLAPSHQIFGGQPADERNRVTVTVQHKQGPPTKLTHLVLYVCSSRMQEFGMRSRLAWLLNRLKVPRPEMFLIPNPETGTLPYRLDVGEDWMCTMVQSEIEKLLKGGRPFIGITHVASDREVIVPLSLPSAAKSAPAEVS